MTTASRPQRAHGAAVSLLGLLLLLPLLLSSCAQAAGWRASMQQAFHLLDRAPRDGIVSPSEYRQNGLPDADEFSEEWVHKMLFSRFDRNADGGLGEHP